MNRIASPGRRGAAAALLLAAWALALALVYLWPAGGSGVRAVFDGSLPDLALTREPVRRLGSLAAASPSSWRRGATDRRWSASAGAAASPRIPAARSRSSCSRSAPAWRRSTRSPSRCPRCICSSRLRWSR